MEDNCSCSPQREATSEETVRGCVWIHDVNQLRQELRSSTFLTFLN